MIVLRDFAVDLPAAEVVAGLHRYLADGQFLFPDEAPYGPLHGYVFVTGAPDAAIRRLALSGYVEHVLMDGLALACLSDQEVRRLLSASCGLSPGQVVEVVSGDYSGLQGSVVRVAGQAVYLTVTLRSGDYPLKLNAHQVRPVKE